MSKNKKLIHIHAKCDAFEIYEVVEEKRAVPRLQKIRNMAIWSENHRKASIGTLIVKTGVVNPELNFH